MKKAEANTPVQVQRPARKPKKRGKGVLAVIGGLLVASAVARVGIHASSAVALETSPPAEAGQTSDQPQEDGSTAPPKDGEISPLLKALKDREDRIKEREAAIASRMQALAVAEQEIERRLVAMEEAEKKLRATLTIAKTAAQEDVDRLTEVYASMKPKQAAALFEEMDPEFAAGFLGQMRPDAAAAIMAGLNPQTAYTISVMLAGRNAGAPRE
ncbi:hypothetical protein GCM10011415_31720 [Salipiger pallidus]|uniref:Magnesium transporter MgtE intracellular domain-containing protein n=1 Tax=Salipiger pallidus TaxID=1775170 RepID=A0A8J2ZLQ0_9RHOB|nr:hypothetical protein [Salipiger pallidus]GGG80050.1 hypothetical protein GCM10011415_31720 [Salipiger pallidus]